MNNAQILLYYNIGKMKQSSYEYNNERSGEETSQGSEGVRSHVPPLVEEEKWNHDQGCCEDW